MFNQCKHSWNLKHLGELGGGRVWGAGKVSCVFIWKYAVKPQTKVTGLVDACKKCRPH